MSNVALITTCGHNIGDDMVREGILYLLQEAGNSYTPGLIHKHFPLSVRTRLDWLHTSGVTRLLDVVSRRAAPMLSELIDRLPVEPRFDKIFCADLLVQCGAPVYWCFDNGNGAHRNEWYTPLIRHRYSRFERKIPFLNIGAGSCQPYGDNGSECSRNEECRSYIRDLHAATDLTIVRDPLASEILSTLDLEAVLLPCPSLFARDWLEVDPGPIEYLAVNFMPLGGHYSLGQEIDPKRWKREFGSFLKSSARRSPLVLACHNRNEYEIAGTCFPETPRRYLDSTDVALRFYSRAGAFIGSRVHGAMAVASFGRPIFVVGTDTRVRTVEPIGCSHSFVEEMSAQSLEDALSGLVSTSDDFARRMEDLRQKTCERYMDLLAFLKERDDGQDRT